MARLASAPVAGDWEWHDGEDYKVYDKRTEALLKALEDKSASLPVGEIVGCLVSFPVADGQAVYVVTKERPLTLAHVPIGDKWHISDAHMRGLRKEDILEQQRRWRAIKAIHNAPPCVAE